MNELGFSAATAYGSGYGSGYGADTRSRAMHTSFYGHEANLNQSQLAGAESAQTISQSLASEEWRKAGLEGVFPTELVQIISQLTANIGSKFDLVIDYLSEAFNASELRQRFGEPQLPGALPVAIQLTALAEEAYDQTQVMAERADQEIFNLRAKIQKTILVWLLAEEARHQAMMDQLTGVETEVDDLKVTTTQASHETKGVKTVLAGRKQEVALLLRLAKDKVANFFGQMLNSSTMNSAEVLIYSAKTQTASLPELAPSKAMPIFAT